MSKLFYYLYSIFYECRSSGRRHRLQALPDVSGLAP